MRTVLLFIFLPFYFSFAQTIKGTVVNDADHRIPNVNIYIDGTKIGTTSKEDGSFIIELPSRNKGSLVFQKEDYETFTTDISKVYGKTLKVVLIKTAEIEEVQLIPYTEEAYKNHIYTFLSNFIGSDKENVKIKNQRTLKFAYDKKNNFLSVKAPKTLIIENKKLGYEIEYNLINFSLDYNTNMVNFTGTSFFRETKNTDKTRLNRMNAYEGSLLHFFRSAYHNKVHDAGFVVNKVIKVPNPKYPTESELKLLREFLSTFKPSGNFKIPDNISDISQRKNKEKPYGMAIVKMNIPESDYIKKSDGRIFLEFPDVLQVKFLKYNYEIQNKEFIKTKTPVGQQSYLYIEGQSFEIYDSGNTSDPDLLINQGDFSTNRIENMLPLDYQLGD
ncbi:carboxypeptidase-like regulatory domain-containing protein [Chryseobacterium gossypii]|uniref:carboxypeptidase-like regulatory domain-containing protein n=1 Tax=Chryseobacterium gossypii TaxID=3231602 RepID=UPI0035232602